MQLKSLFYFCQNPKFDSVFFFLSEVIFDQNTSLTGRGSGLKETMAKITYIKISNRLCKTIILNLNGKEEGNCVFSFYLLKLN